MTGSVLFQLPAPSWRRARDPSFCSRHSRRRKPHLCTGLLGRVLRARPSPLTSRLLDRLTVS